MEDVDDLVSVVDFFDSLDDDVLEPLELSDEADLEAESLLEESPLDESPSAASPDVADEVADFLPPRLSVL